MDIHDSIMDIQNAERYARKIIDIHNWIVGVNIELDYGYP